MHTFRCDQTTPSVKYVHTKCSLCIFCVFNSVTAAQKPNILQPFKDTKSPIGGTIIFTTKVRAFPPAKVVWKINGEIVEESEQVTVEFTKPMAHTLTIKEAPETLHDATVSLVASNVAGEATTESKLTVKGRAPKFITKPIKCTVLEGTCGS